MLDNGSTDNSWRIIPNKEILDRFQQPPSKVDLEKTINNLELEGIVGNSIIFLTVSRLIVAKNIEKMLRAFAMTTNKSPNIFYLIAGEGPLRSHLERLVQLLGIEEKVRFLGYVPHNELRCLYHISDVFYYATLYEGQPRVIVEALLSNLPIICTNYGQVCEVVEYGMDGLWVDPNDIESITDAIIQLASDANLRNKMSEHTGFDAQQFSVEQVSEQEAALYLATIQKHCKRRK